ncbi:MAG: SH3 domain-containing protein [Clostridiales bacterium]|nr:SH3 domain-containing protein [Clostridiales bacterium]
MKKLLFGIALISALYCCPVYGQDSVDVNETVTAAQFENLLNEVTDTYTMYSIVDGLNIRAEPNTVSEVLGQAYLNTSFEAVMGVGGWTMITTEDGYAYVKSEYLASEESELEYLGKFKISHYCCEKYKHICGTGTGKTATGLDVRPGMISVDPKIIPLGSTIVFNGNEYVAVDTGGMIKGKKIDLAVETHKEALDLGVYYADVYIKKNNE